MNQYTNTSELSRTIEALLFSSNSPLSPSRLLSLTVASSKKEIREAVESLREFYRKTNRSFQVVEVAGGYQITTLPEFSDTVSRMFKTRRKTRLSRPALETLAIIAYQQPVPRMKIEAIRGVNCDGVLSTLVEKELITITGRGEGVGRPYLYSTTKKFLEYLGLKDYRDLPDIEEIEKGFETMDLIPVPAMNRKRRNERDGEEEDSNHTKEEGED